MSTPRPAAAALAALASSTDTRPALATGAYCRAISSCALADQGISSQSRQTQSVSSRSQNRAASSARRTWSSSCRSSSPFSNIERPVRVWQTPAPLGGETPNRRSAAASSRHTTTTDRDPMCFSSHTTRRTPPRAK